MAQLFKDPDSRRRWEGYWIHFYAKEHLPPDSKPLNWIHIHFRGQNGEAELYLKHGYPDYRIVKQWGKISEETQTLMKKFVQDNYQDIVSKIQKDLKEVGIEWDRTF
jgi:predicted DNA-binding WGR domain protein